MTNRIEDALRALEQKWLEIATYFDTGRRPKTIQATQLRICARELSAILRQTEAAPSPLDVHKSFGAICELPLGNERNAAFLWFSHGFACQNPTPSPPDSSEGGPVAWIEIASRVAKEILLLLPEDAIADPHGMQATHLTFMAERLALGNVGSETKTCRWLGYLQCGLVMRGLSTLSVEKDRNSRHAGAVKYTPPPSSPQVAVADGGRFAAVLAEAGRIAPNGQGGESSQYISGWKDVLEFISRAYSDDRLLAAPQSAPIEYPKHKAECPRCGQSITVYGFPVEEAAPADDTKAREGEPPVELQARHWNQAVADWANIGDADVIGPERSRAVWIEQRARSLAQEGK